jgi:arginyl-tRNA synthetase
MSDHLSLLKKELMNLVNELIIDKIISDSFNINALSIDYQSTSRQGDVSTNLLIILNKKKLDTNIDLQSLVIKKLNNIKYISDIEIAKVGFINIFFDKLFLIKNLNEVLVQKNSYGIKKSKKNNNINIEFVSANPTGPVHIGHLRGAVLGDVLASVLTCSGYNVTREYYVNDAGSQIKNLGKSLYKRYLEIFEKKIEISKNDYPGEYLISIAKEIRKKDGDKWLDNKEKNLEEYFENYAISEMINLIKNDLKKINIKFDNFVYESDIVNDKSIEKVFNVLTSKDLLYEGFLDKPKGEDSEDWKPRKQLLFRSTNFNDDSDRPFKKADGEWTYFANDAAYHYDKFSRKFDKLINIWGADHIGYISRMKSIVSVISNKKDFLDIKVCQIVRLIKNGNLLKMSKREGNFITINEILKEVGTDALRYFMISTKSETTMDFDMNKVIEKNKDNPVFYCQYAYARASSVLKKYNSFSEFDNVNIDFKKIDMSLISKTEWQIILKILSWPYLINQVSENKEPHRITNYLEDLCSDFHSFWNKGKDDQSLRMIDVENIDQTISKIFWIQSFRVVLKNAFTIIGIDAPESM